VSPLLIIGLSIFGLMVINANLIQSFLDRKTRPKKVDIYDQSQIFFLFVFLGIFVVPFMKQIKRYRWILYLKKRLKELKDDKELSFIRYGKNDPSFTPEKIQAKIRAIERTLKLERIKKKS
jgi:hypothetical protein